MTVIPKIAKGIEKNGSVFFIRVPKIPDAFSRSNSLLRMVISHADAGGRDRMIL